jgi:NNP family nitrate/nitrite transporter-like MFS transporter
VALFGPTAKEFKDLLDLTPTAVALLVAAPALSGSLLRIPFAAWVDTSGGRRPFLVLMATSVVGMTGLAGIVATMYPDDLTAGIYPVLLFLAVLSGAGIATFSVGIGQVSYWFPQGRQGWALGTFAGAGNLAPGIFSILIPVVLAGFGLSTAYIAWLVMLILGTVLYFRLGQNAPYFQLRNRGLDVEDAQRRARKMGQELFPAGGALDTLRISARVWKTWLLVALYFTSFGGFIALTAWLPTYWQEFFDTSLLLAGALTASFSILASVIRIPGGSLSDRYGGERIAMLSLSTLLAGAIIMVMSHNMGMSILGQLLMGTGMGVSNAAVFKLVPQEIPEAVGGAAGWVGGLGAFGGFAIPPVMALFVDSDGATGYNTGFVVFVGLAALSLTLAYVLNRTPSRARVTLT